MIRTIALATLLLLGLASGAARAGQTAQKRLLPPRAKGRFPTRRQKAAREVVMKGTRLAEVIAGRKGSVPRVAAGMLAANVTASVARLVEGKPGRGRLSVVDHGIDSNGGLHDPNADMDELRDIVTSERARPPQKGPGRVVRQRSDPRWDGVMVGNKTIEFPNGAEISISTQGDVSPYEREPASDLQLPFDEAAAISIERGITSLRQTSRGSQSVQPIVATFPNGAKMTVLMSSAAYGGRR